MSVFEHSEEANNDHSLDSTVNSDDDDLFNSHSSQESEGQATSTSLNEDNLPKMTKQVHLVTCILYQLYIVRNKWSF